MAHDFDKTGLDDDTEVLVIVQVESQDTVMITEYDPDGTGYEAELEHHLGGWPEEAELDEESPADLIGATVWVNADALGEDLNILATELVGYDIYGTAVITKEGRGGMILGLSKKDLDHLFQEVSVKLKEF